MYNLQNRQSLCRPRVQEAARKSIVSVNAYDVTWNEAQQSTNSIIQGGSINITFSNSPWQKARQIRIALHHKRPSKLLARVTSMKARSRSDSYPIRAQPCERLFQGGSKFSAMVVISFENCT